MKKYCLSLFLLFFILSSFAQSQSGCMIVGDGNNNILYPTANTTSPTTTTLCGNGTPVPVYSGTAIVPPIGCVWQPGVVDPGANRRTCMVQSGSRCGVLVVNRVIACPLDSYVIILNFLVFIVGLMSLRKFLIYPC